MRHCSLDMEGGRKRRSFSLISSSVRPSKRYRVCEGKRERGGRERDYQQKCRNMGKQMQLKACRERERSGDGYPQLRASP